MSEIVQPSLRPMAIIDEYLIVEPWGYRRFFGLVTMHPRLIRGSWIMTSPIVDLNVAQGLASTFSGTRNQLDTPMTRWSSDARSTLRAFAQKESWEADVLPEQARLKPGESLAGVPDAVWATTAKVVNLLGLPWPERNVTAVTEFLNATKPAYLEARSSAEQALLDASPVDQADE